MALRTLNGRLLSKGGHLCTTCCKPSRYKCDVALSICLQTDDPIGPGVFLSLAECIRSCGTTPCETEGCAFQVQFYYLQLWGFHKCNRAVFNAYCGGRLLGLVNLNNEYDGGSRTSQWFDVTAEDFDAETCSYSFSLKCTLSECHFGVAGMRLSTGHNYPAMVRDNWAISANEICNPSP